MSELTPKTKMLRLGVTRNYGAHAIYFEVAEQLELDNFEQQQDAFDNLTKQLNFHVARYEEFILPHTKLPQGGTSPSSQSAFATETFKVDKLIVENLDGKRRVKAAGGKYERFGVPCYKECESKIALDSLEYGAHDYSHLGLTATIELENGKPKRVRSIA